MKVCTRTQYADQAGKKSLQNKPDANEAGMLKSQYQTNTVNTLKGK